MAMSYSELIGAKTANGSIAQWVNFSDSKMPITSFIEDAQNAIYQTLRVREMKVLETGTIAIDDVSLSLPSDYLTAITLNLTGDNKSVIDILDPEHFESIFGQDSNNSPYPGTPSQGQIVDNKIYFNSKSDLALAYRFVYFKTPALLSASNETNFLTSRYSHIIRAMCVSKAFEFLKDEQSADRYLSMAEGYILKANSEYDMERAAENFQFHSS